VAREFERFARGDVGVLAALDRRMIERQSETLSLAASAWLYRWERAHEQFRLHATSVPGGLAATLRISLRIESGTIRQAMWRAALP